MKILHLVVILFLSTSSIANANTISNSILKFSVNKSNIKPSGSSAAAQKQRNATQSQNRANHGAKRK
jgi:hypothetical protein